METVLHDLRYAFRMLAKNPVVTGAALLSLALGLGANTTIFTLVNAVFLRGLPVADPDTLVSVFTTENSEQRLGNYMPLSKPNFEDIRDRTEVFSDVVNVFFTGASLAVDDGEPELVGGQMVTSNYFTALGVRAAAGRFFVPETSGESVSEVPGSQPVVVLSHRYWSTRFGADPAIVGREVKLNEHPFTVIGVAPQGFHGTFVLGNPSFWVPASMHEVLLTGFNREYFDDRRALMTNAFARLAPGVSVDRAAEAVNSLGLALQEEYPVHNKDRSFTVLPAAEAAVNPNQRDVFNRAGGLMMTVVGLVLLIACANVANLFLGRAAARRREIGVRLALGAKRGRLVRQLLTESLVLATLAGGLGLLVALWARNALWSLRPPFLQKSGLDLGFDPEVMFFTAGLTLVTGVLFGLAPAVQSTSPRIVGGLNQASDSAVGSGRVFSFKNLLVIAQVALSLVALIGTGLFLRSLDEATRVDLGFEHESLGMMNLNLAPRGYDAERGEQFYDQLLERVSAVPGVEAASLTTSVPLAGASFWRTVIVEGRDEGAENNRILVPVNTVSPNYLAAAGIELRAGRGLSDADRADTQPVAVISEAMAERFWPGEDAIGKRFQFYDVEAVREVVGVVADTKYVSVGEDPQPQAFLPRHQNYVPGMSLVVRAHGDPATLLASVRGTVRELDPALPVTNEQPVSVIIDQALWAARMAATLLAIFGGLALLLAAIGIYGVMAYNVGQRDRELGVRVALGAERRDILALVLGQGMKVVAVGLVLGLAVAALVGRFIAGLLYGVDPMDPVTFVLTLAVLAGVAVVANLIPARRAIAVDPVIVLRFER